jgi:hypothetical protein
MIFTLSFKLEVKVPKINKTYQCFSAALHEADSRYKWREKSGDSAVNIATRLGAEGSGVLIPVGATDFLQNVETCYGSHTFSYSAGTGNRSLPRTQSGRGARMDTHLHLAPMLRMSGSIPPFPIYAFMACTKKFFTLVRNDFQRYHTWLVVRTRLWRFQMGPPLKTR